MKKLDIISLYKDYSIPYATSGSKHTMPGWINTNCCFCGGKDYHLGFHEATEHFHCWCCGFKTQNETISALLGVSLTDAKAIIKAYRSNRVFIHNKPLTIIKAPKVILPGVSLTLTTPEKQPVRGQILTIDPYMTLGRAYLEKRGFKGQNLTDLINLYNLHVTGPIGPYKFRIIIPIYVDGELVSYQGRDYTGQSDLRYKACKKTDEVKDHKSCLYAMDLAKGDTVVVVEGVVDAWKLGAGAVATFGTSFLPSQVKILAEQWKNRVILFDKTAKREGEKLANMLSGFNGTTELAILNESKDPGEIPIEKARKIMKMLRIT